MEKLQGIYKITNVANGKIYIGSSIDIRKRWSQHKNKLRNNKHYNRHLQSAWNKNGEENFIFEAIAIINEREMILPIEQVYIETTKCYLNEIGYNKEITARANYDYKHSKETLKANRENGLTTLSDDAKKKISLANRGKNKYGEIIYTEKEVKEIYLLLHNNVSMSKISEIYDLSHNVVKNIKNGRLWEDVINTIDLSSPLSDKLKEIADNTKNKKVRSNNGNIKESADRTKERLGILNKQNYKMPFTFRGRNNKGEIVLTEEKVMEILILIHHGATITECIGLYNISPNAIRRVHSGNTWDDVKEAINFEAPLSEKILKILEKINKDREYKKENPTPPLTIEQKEMIINLLDSKTMTQKEIALEIGVTLFQVKDLSKKRRKLLNSYSA